MNAEYIKTANKLLCGITDKRLREPAYGTIFFLLFGRADFSFGRLTMKFCA